MHHCTTCKVSQCETNFGEYIRNEPVCVTASFCQLNDGWSRRVKQDWIFYWGLCTKTSGWVRFFIFITQSLSLTSLPFSLHLMLVVEVVKLLSSVSRRLFTLVSLPLTIWTQGRCSQASDRRGMVECHFMQRQHRRSGATPNPATKPGGRLWGSAIGFSFVRNLRTPIVSVYSSLEVVRHPTHGQGIHSSPGQPAAINPPA